MFCSSEAFIKKARNGRKLQPNDIKAEDIEDDILSANIQLIKPLLTESAWVLLHKEGYIIALYNICVNTRKVGDRCMCINKLLIC